MLFRAENFAVDFPRMIFSSLPLSSEDAHMVAHALLHDIGSLVGRHVPSLSLLIFMQLLIRVCGCNEHQGGRHKDQSE